MFFGADLRSDLSTVLLAIFSFTWTWRLRIRAISRTDQDRDQDQDQDQDQEQEQEQDQEQDQDQDQDQGEDQEQEDVPGWGARGGRLRVFGRDEVHVGHQRPQTAAGDNLINNWSI